MTRANFTRHIKDRLETELEQQGWVRVICQFSDDLYFRKRVEDFAPAGTLSSGARVMSVRMDVTGRWLERVDGWGKVEKGIDLREFWDHPATVALASVLV